MKILVTGSRDWPDEDKVGLVIASAIQQAGMIGSFSLQLLHGACPTGADAMADQWWTQNIGPHSIVKFPADWRGLGAAAGPLRNMEMVEARPDLVLAFVCPCSKPNCPRATAPHDSHGTTNCIALAKSAGIPVMIYRRDWPSE